MEKVPLVRLSLECNVPRLVSYDSSPFPLPASQRNTQVSLNSAPELLWYLGGVTLEGGCWWEPHYRETWRPGDIAALHAQQVQRFLGALSAGEL